MLSRLTIKAFWTKQLGKDLHILRARGGRVYSPFYAKKSRRRLKKNMMAILWDCLSSGHLFAGLRWSMTYVNWDSPPITALLLPLCRGSFPLHVAAWSGPFKANNCVLRPLIPPKSGGVEACGKLEPSDISIGAIAYAYRGICPCPCPCP